MEVIKVCLIKYNKTFINSVSIITSIVIVVFLSFGINKIKNRFLNTNNDFAKVVIGEKEKIEDSEDTEDIEINNTIFKEGQETKDQNLSKNVTSNDKLKEKNSDQNEFDWYIEIPKIKLYAPIEEGTNEEILNRSVGHFENTSRRNGNCGLAAHNRGYRVNYFARIKELEIGDQIFYFVDGKKYEYEITDISVIYETDWSILEETEKSKITLITCIENKEEYRLCIQGILVDK